MGLTTRFEEICLELKSIPNEGWAFERTFRKIALMSKAEEGCTIFQAKAAVACWWDASDNILTEENVMHTCLAAFPLHALRVLYNKTALCDKCFTHEQGITGDGKSKYIKHKPGCLIMSNSTSTG